MIEGVYFVPIRRTGKPTIWYVYAWRGGPPIMKAEGPNKPKLTPAAIKAIAEAQEEARAIQPDMLASVVRQLRGVPGRPETMSSEWSGLAAGTRDLWGFQLNLIEDKWGSLPLALWNDPRMVAKVVAWRDSRAATPRAADEGVKVLKYVLDFARLRAKVDINVAADIPTIYKGADRAEIIWLADEIDRFSCAAIALNRPHLIDGIWLAALTGMRRADLVGLTWDEVSDHAIVRIARKKSKGRRRRAVIPIIPQTAQLLAELRDRPRADGVKTVLVNSAGRPWTPGSFTQAFNQVRDLARIIQPGDADLGIEPKPKHLHDLRGTFVTHLCRVGLTDEEIANIVAWSKENVGRVRKTYVDDAQVVVALSQRIRAIC